MSKLLKIFGVMLSLIAGAAGLVAVLFDPNDYKEDLRAAFVATTGHELVIDGPLRISLLPFPALEIAGASLPGALGSDGPALAEIDLVWLYPRLLPLLTGRLEWELVRVKGLRLWLIRDEQGRASWDVSEIPQAPRGMVRVGMPLRFATTAKSPGPFDVMAAEAHPATDGLVIGGVEILDGRFIWDDRRSERRLEIDKVEVFVGPIAPHDPVAWRMTGFMLNGDGGSSTALRAEGSLSIDDGPRRLRLEPLMLGLDGLDLGKDIKANFLLRTGLEADLGAGRYLADEAVLEIQVAGAALTGSRIEATAGASVELDLGADRLEVTGLSVRSGTLSASGKVLGQALLTAPVLTGDLAVDELDPRAWLEPLGLPLPRTADAETFRRFSLKTGWRLEDGRFDLRGLVVNMDQTELSGDVERLATSPPGYRFDLVADQLDLDRYLPPVGRAQPGPGKTSQWSAPAARPAALKVGFSGQMAPASYVKTSATSGPGPARIPVAAKATGSLDLDGRLRIGELKLAQLRFGDADLRIRAKDGSLDIDNRVGRFYQGRLEGRLGLDLHGAEPGVTLVQRAQEIQIGPLLADLIGEDRLTGRGEISVDLTASGRSADALERSLGGNLSIHIPQGAVKGVNLERTVRNAQARLQGKQPPTDLPMQTDFKDLRASGKVQNGILSNQDLVASADHLRITGAGTLDLVKKRLDYRFEPVFVKPPRGRGIKELEGVPIPVHLTGPFDRPRWQVDIGSTLKAAAERRLNEQGGDLFKELEERTGIKGLGEGLKGLFGR